MTTQGTITKQMTTLAPTQLQPVNSLDYKRQHQLTVTSDDLKAIFS
jgi:hypothetical protein